MRVILLLISITFFISSNNVSYAASGHVLINLPDFSEKQVDSISAWFKTDINIIESGICLESKLLMIRLQEKNNTNVQEIFDRLKKHGIENFFLKDEITLDRFRQYCTSYFPFQ